jgi:hypothetical protein
MKHMDTELDSTWGYEQSDMIQSRQSYTYNRILFNLIV